MPITITVGKTYINSIGFLITIIKQIDQPPYHFVGENKINGYKNNFNSSGESLQIKNNKHNLLREYVEEVIDVPSLNIEVGKRYLNRDGTVVTIIKKVISPTLVPIIGIIRGEQQSYTIDGYFFASKTCTMSDLVSEVKEPIIGSHFVNTVNNHIFQCIGLNKFMGMNGEEYIKDFVLHDVLKNREESYAIIPAKVIPIKEFTTFDLGVVFSFCGKKYLKLHSTLYQYISEVDDIRLKEVDLSSEKYFVTDNFIYRK